MRFSKIIATLSAAVLVVACGSPAQEGSKETLALLPSSSQIDSASYLIGVNFGSWIKGNNFGELNYNEIVKGIKDFMKAEGSQQDSNFVKQFKINPEEMNAVLDGFIQKRRAYTGALNNEKGEDYIAKFLQEEGIESFAVTETRDALSLRRASENDRLQKNIHLLVIDDYGLDELNDQVVYGLNEIADARYNVGSTIFTTQLNRKGLTAVKDKAFVYDSLFDKLFNDSGVYIQISGESKRGKAGEARGEGKE